MFIKPGEKMLHEALHKERADDEEYLRAQLKNPRLNTIKEAEEKISKTVSGRVIDYGCGSGYLSAWLAINRSIDVAYAVEITDSAVESLIPRMIEFSGAPSKKVRPALGTFATDFGEPGFDYAFSMGALHHANNLQTAFDGIFRALKPGSYRMAQKPLLADQVSNEVFL